MRRVAVLAAVLTGTAWPALVAHADDKPQGYELRAVGGCKPIPGHTAQGAAVEIRCRAGRQRISVVAYGSAEGICAPQPSSIVRCDHGEPFGMQLSSGQRICICVVSGSNGGPSSLVVGVPIASAVVKGTVEEPADAIRVIQVAGRAEEFLNEQH